MCFHRFFKALFLLGFWWVFEQVKPVKSIKTLRRPAKITSAENKQNRSRARFGMDLGVIFGVQLVTNVFFCRTNECRKTVWKKYPRKVKRVETGRSQGSWTAPPKVKDCLSNKQQLNKKLQQVIKNTNNCRVVASVRLLLCMFLVRFLQFDCCCFCVLFDFKFKMMLCLFLVRFQTQGPWSDTPWARLGEF